jgi:hypothetical protein
MPAVDDKESVTVTFPGPTMERVKELARQKNATTEQEIQHLVEYALHSEATVREKLEALSESYRARLNREGRLNQSAEQVMAELRRIREQVADELHPD